MSVVGSQAEQTHVELESGVEVLVRHDVDLGEARVHPAVPRKDPI